MGEVVATIEEAVLHMLHPTAPTMRAAFGSLDHTQPCDHFRLRVEVVVAAAENVAPHTTWQWPGFECQIAREIGDVQSGGLN